MTTYADPAEDYQTIDRLNAKIKELEAENANQREELKHYGDMGARIIAELVQARGQIKALKAENERIFGLYRQARGNIFVAALSPGSLQHSLQEQPR